MLNKFIMDVSGAFKDTASNIKEQKFFGTGSLVQFLPGQKYESQEDYVTLVKNGYNRNGQVYACVDYRSRAFASASWHVYRKSPNGDKIIIDNDARNDLFEQPNESQSWTEFAYQWCANDLLVGENYSKKAMFMNQVSGLWNMVPYRVKVNVGRTPDDIISYTFGQNSANEITIKASEVMRQKTFNPLDPFHGLSRVRVASMTVDQNNFGKEWNAQLMQNSGRPDGMFNLEGTIGEEQRTAFKEEIRRKFSGKDNAGKPLVAGGKWTYTPLSMPSKDMEWIKTMKMTGGDICTVFQVPAMLIGDSDNKTYSNYGEARKHFSEDVAFYDLVRARNTMNMNLLTEDERRNGIYIDFDVSELPAYKESENDLVERLAKRTWWTDNEKREAEGKEPVEGGDELNKPKENIVVEGQQIEDPKKNPKKDPKKKNLPSFSCLNMESKADKERYCKQFDGERIEFSKAVQPIVQKQLKRDMNGILKTVKESGIPEEFEDQFKGYLEQHSEQWAAVLGNINKGVANQFSKRTFNSFKGLPRDMEFKGDEEEIEASESEINEYVQNVTGIKVSEINKTTLSKLQNIVAEGLANSWTIGEYEKAIELLYLKQMIPNRSEVIARTEVIAASNLGSQSMAKSSGLVLEKEWSDAGDRRVRATHLSMDGKRLPIDENWIINGKELAFPGDSSLGAKASDTIQCRCIELYFEIGEEE